ncbi:hypothetical protein FKW77_003338 [Venturia effusa]|uniref:Uncharacterized protein n=1 Tax=Venturia effusa TaxID=50376 RepID=A0A517LPW2_9PEZI|nr:hypothetical protein FKW77_003338 [Venturia effusa]
MDGRDICIEKLETKNVKLSNESLNSTKLDARSTKTKTLGEKDQGKVKVLKAKNEKPKGQIHTILEAPEEEEEVLAEALTQAAKNSGHDQASPCQKLREANKQVARLGQRVTSLDHRLAQAT